MEDSPDPSRLEYKHGLLEPNGWGSATYRQDVSANQRLLTAARGSPESGRADGKAPHPPSLSIHRLLTSTLVFFLKNNVPEKSIKLGHFREIGNRRCGVHSGHLPSRR